MVEFYFGLKSIITIACIIIAIISVIFEILHK